MSCWHRSDDSDATTPSAALLRGGEAGAEQNSQIMKTSVELTSTLVRHTGVALRSNTPLRRLLILAWHAVGTHVTYLLAFQLRFDGQVPLDYRILMWQSLPGLLLVYLLFFALFRLNSGLWSYFSVDDLARTISALALATGTFGVIVLAFRGMSSPGYPRSVLAIEFLLMGAWMTGGRFAARYLRARTGERETEGAPNERTLIVGRLQDADLVVRAARNGGIGRVVGIVTDQAADSNLTLHGIRILGTARDLGDALRKTRANRLLILPPFNKPRQMNEIVGLCADQCIPCAFQTLPSMAELTTGRITATSLREVDVEDLLGRGEAVLDRSEVRRFLKGKRIMVTGAGGSIGSELCRQIATYEPFSLTLFELSEIALYTIEQELALRYPSLQLSPCAGDIRHPEEIEAAIRRAGGIDIIFHAAAYKHVPLMEQNVPACFRTNVLGTARLADVARRAGVDRFVMISSDKAVRPTSIMGATKRLAERIVCAPGPGTTSFVSVRFGNVLGSSGSVIPLFKRQIAAGGPVTVTSPDMRRFFMTIPEAVDLVLLAGTVGRNRDIMVLEMGESIRIVDLARRLIELSGLVPEKDIQIAFTGLRPGEKEYEEVMTLDENVTRTAFEKIWVMTHSPSSTAVGALDLEKVESLCRAHDSDGLRDLIRSEVPEHRLGGANVHGAEPTAAPWQNRMEE